MFAWLDLLFNDLNFGWCKQTKQLGATAFCDARFDFTLRLDYLRPKGFFSRLDVMFRIRFIFTQVGSPWMSTVFLRRCYY